MTVRVVEVWVRCDGSGCAKVIRGSSWVDARRRAVEAGWTLNVNSADLCPDCSGAAAGAGEGGEG